MATASSESGGEGCRVVIGIDGSDHSQYAFKWYVDNVHKPNNRVFLVHCPEYKPLLNAPYLTSDPAKMSDLARDEENNTKLLVARLKEDVQSYGINGCTIRAAGDPGEAILKIAQAENANYVVMGSRGLSKVRRTFMGSVSDYVMHHASCAVIVVRNREKIVDEGK